MSLTQEQLENAAEIGFAMSSQVRLELLDAVGRQGEASATTLESERVVAVNLASYHLRKLESIGAVRLHEVRPVKGVAEKRYRLTPRGQSILTLVADL